MVGDDVVDMDSRAYRRMRRRFKANQISRAAHVIEKNVAAAAVPRTTEVITIDDDSDNLMYLDFRVSGIPGYVDHLDDYDINNTNDDNTCVYGANKCADYCNAEGGSDINIDPDYKVFLDNVRGKRNGMVLSFGNVVIRYGNSEDDAESSSGERTCDPTTINTAAKVDINYADNLVYPLDNHCVETTLLKSKIKGSNKRKCKYGREFDECDPEYKLVLSSMAVDAPSGRIGQCTMVKRGNKYGGELADCDPDYFLFLSSMAAGATSVRSGQCEEVRYGQNVKDQHDQNELESNKQKKNSVVKLGDSVSQNESDCDVIILDLDPCFGGEHTPFVSSKDYVASLDDYKISDSGRNGSSEYREELIELLKKPFVEEEYKQLLEAVYRKELVVRDIDLRSGPRPFKTKIMGKSYTDLHEDFHSKICEAKLHHPKVLNIMRGFFFWLQVEGNNVGEAIASPIRTQYRLSYCDGLGNIQ